MRLLKEHLDKWIHPIRCSSTAAVQNSLRGVSLECSWSYRVMPTWTRDDCFQSGSLSCVVRELATCDSLQSPFHIAGQTTLLPFNYEFQSPSLTVYDDTHASACTRLMSDLWSKPLIRGIRARTETLTVKHEYLHKDSNAWSRYCS